MIKFMNLAVLAAVFILGAPLASHAQRANAGNGDGQIYHDIFITLKDKSPKAVEEQLALGKKYLVNHPGEVSFSSTVLANNLTPHKQVPYLFNDDEFDVAFHLVFANRKAHDTYQLPDQHVGRFIPESNPNWVKIRVFDLAE